ncbi:MAG: type II secretion system GspH family protein [Colwellia sp.]|nr:type II secretion system GspH family protein [Colwellia sp.]
MSVSKKVNMKKGNHLINRVKAQQGFTLIELVIVVVILGFLAVTAIPKFLDLTEQAKQANIEGMAGGFATGVSLARAQWEAEARPNDGGTPKKNFVDYDGTTVYLTVEDTTTTPKIRPGYILGTAETSTLADVACLAVWDSLLQQPPQITDSITTLNSDSKYDYFTSKASTSGNPVCHYYLKETLARASNGDFETPGVSTAIGNSFTYQPVDSSVIVYINK